MQPLAGHVVILMGTGPGSSLGYPSGDFFGLVWFDTFTCPYLLLMILYMGCF